MTRPFNIKHKVQFKLLAIKTNLGGRMDGMYYTLKRNLFCIVLLLSIFVPFSITAQETTPPVNGSCGLADAIMFPVESVATKTIGRGYDDFSIQRSQFGINHTAIDVAFYEQGEPVFAAARGRVTYADIRGWNDERGVVIIGHDFPDGNRYYTVYGHMEEADAYLLPTVGDCVEMGDVIGAIGWPTSSSPHLHYEIRSILPDDGGPGYTDDNPLDAGWFHPLDFTRLWQMRFSPVMADYATFRVPITVAPVWLDNGQAAAASGDTVLVTAPNDGGTVWQVTMDDLVTQVAALPGSRVVAQSQSGLTIIVAGGRFEASWTVADNEKPFVLVNETLVFATKEGTLRAYNTSGEQIWRIDAPPNVTSLLYFADNGQTIGSAIETASGVIWRVMALSGEVLYETTFASAPLVAPVLMGGWMLLVEGELWRIIGDMGQMTGTVDIRTGHTARLAADLSGNSYLYAGNEDNALLSWDAAGGLRWQTSLSALADALFAPLLVVDGDCLLYSLDMNGRLVAYNAATGEQVDAVELYPGGNRDKRPNTRLLQVAVNGQIQASAGYLSIVRLNGRLFGDGAFGGCLLG